MSAQLRKILMVEDDPDITLLARIALEEVGGYEVEAFETGAEALARVADIAPDLVILDYRMPGMTGAEVLEALRRIPATVQTPVVFMTASVMPNQVAKLLALGASAVIPKPFDPVDLPEKIRGVWEKYLDQSAS
jgi:CheY-like chemotaxis protein